MRRSLVTLALAAALVVAGLAVTAPNAAGRWVIEGRGWGHGVGMSQYGAYGYARHGRGYRAILSHYYRRTRIDQVDGRHLDVLLDAGAGSVGVSGASRACGRDIRRKRTYRLVRSRRHVILHGPGGGRIRDCGRSGVASGGATVRVVGEGTYRGKLVVKPRGGGLLTINRVQLESYVRSVIANEMPYTWPADALRTQAVAARSYALATRRKGPFDLYNDTRSQAYGGRAAETAATNAATQRTAGEVLKHGRRIALTLYSSSSGGRTESIQFAFAGAPPKPYLRSVRDPYDGLSPYHRWRVRLSQGQMESRLAGLVSGHLRRIRVTKRGDSPRIVRARVIGSNGSDGVSGETLRGRLGLRSTWAKFRRR
jgi:stage II sporulation protein D